MEKKKPTAASAAKAKEAAEKAKAAKGASKKTTKEAPEKKAPAKKAPAKKEPAKKEPEAQEPEAQEPEEVREEVEKTGKKPASNADNGDQVGKVKGLRIGAIILWVLALACEAGAFYVLSLIALNMNTVTLSDPIIILFIGILVLDAVLCIIAAQLWKKALRIKPCLNNSAFVRTVVHQLGVIMTLVCLLPIGIVFLLKSKDMNKRLRTILLVIMAVLFAGTTAASVDYKQPNSEEVAELQEAAGSTDDSTVYWTKYGKSFHLYDDCQSLTNTKPENLFSGPMGGIDDAGYVVDMSGESAFENNRYDLCDFCEKRAGADQGDETETEDEVESLEPAA